MNKMLIKSNGHFSGKITNSIIIVVEVQHNTLFDRHIKRSKLLRSKNKGKYFSVECINQPPICLVSISLNTDKDPTQYNDRTKAPFILPSNDVTSRISHIFLC